MFNIILDSFNVLCTFTFCGHFYMSEYEYTYIYIYPHICIHNCFHIWIHLWDRFNDTQITYTLVTRQKPNLVNMSQTDLFVRWETHICTYKHIEYIHWRMPCRYYRVVWIAILSLSLTFVKFCECFLLYIVTSYVNNWRRIMLNGLLSVRICNIKQYLI